MFSKTFFFFCFICVSNTPHGKLIQNPKNKRKKYDLLRLKKIRYFKKLKNPSYFFT